MANQGETGGIQLSSLTSHYLPLYTADQMRRTDAAAIKGMGVPGVVLMERAGLAVAEHLLESFCEAHCFVVLAGKGNNGGDGFVAARHLMEDGAEVRVFAAGRAADYKGDALVNLKILARLGLKVEHMPSRAVLGRALATDCIIVDAVFGTGFSGEPRGKAAEFIAVAAAAAERHGIPVVAVDIASGVDASTGEVAKNTLPADTTITFHTPKLGHFVEPGAYFSGDIILADIGIPADASVPADHFLIDPEIVAALVPPKMEFDHKFSTGRVLVAGGSTGLTGAACMASESALRAGAGVVIAAVPASLNPIFEEKLLEVMSAPLDDEGAGCLTESALKALLEKTGFCDCAAFGPGLGKSDTSVELATKFMSAAGVPVVLDADGLSAFAGRLGRLKRRSAPTVLTPHTGELGRLLGVPATEVAAHRLAYARQAAKKAGAVVVLKGAYTIVTDGAVTMVNTTGNPGLATAGSGDVLTGIIAALVAKGIEPLEAAAAGVFIHGTAADLAAEELGQNNLVASDLIDYLPLAFTGLQGEEDENE